MDGTSHYIKRSAQRLFRETMLVFAALCRKIASTTLDLLVSQECFDVCSRTARLVHQVGRSSATICQCIGSMAYSFRSLFMTSLYRNLG